MGGWEGGGAGGGGGWEARGRFNLQLGPFGLGMGPRSASHRPKHAPMVQETSPHHWGELQTHAFHVAPSHGSHCLSHEFTGLAKLMITLEKQTSQPSLVIALYMCSVRVWPLAGPIKWKRASVTIWSVYQNPVTYFFWSNYLLPHT